MVLTMDCEPTTATSHPAATGPAAWSAGEDAVRGYGAFAKRLKAGNVDHLFLTSLIDRKGMLRVQYLGYRFDPDEMYRDLRALLRE